MYRSVAWKMPPQHFLKIHQYLCSEHTNMHLLRKETQMETWDTWKVHRGRSLGRRILVRFCPKLEVPAPLMACALIHMWSSCNDQPSRIFTGCALMEYLILEVWGLWVLWMDGWMASVFRSFPCFLATSSLLHSFRLILLVIVCGS